MPIAGLKGAEHQLVTALRPLLKRFLSIGAQALG
jgi:hypothetical protein